MYQSAPPQGYPKTSRFDRRIPIHPDLQPSPTITRSDNNQSSLLTTAYNPYPMTPSSILNPPIEPDSSMVKMWRESYSRLNMMQIDTKESLDSKRLAISRELDLSGLAPLILGTVTTFPSILQATYASFIAAAPFTDKVIEEIFTIHIPLADVSKLNAPFVYNEIHNFFNKLNVISIQQSIMRLQQLRCDPYSNRNVKCYSI